MESLDYPAPCFRPHGILSMSETTEYLMIGTMIFFLMFILWGTNDE